MDWPATAGLTHGCWVTLTNSRGETAAMPCSPYQAELNSCFKLTFQESIWKLQSCPVRTPSNAFCPQPEEGWYPHQYVQFFHTSHLSATQQSLLGGSETVAQKQEHIVLRF